MWSVPRFYMRSDHPLLTDELAVYVGDQSPSYVLWQAEGTVTPDPAMHSAPSLFVYFRQINAASSFRLLFSFHKV